MGSKLDIQHLTLSKAVLHRNQTDYPFPFLPEEQRTIQGAVGETVNLGCRFSNFSKKTTTRKKLTQVSVTTLTDKQVTICSQTNGPDCWHNFT